MIPLTRRWRVTLAGCMALAGPGADARAEEPLIFDAAVLAKRGFDPRLASDFQHRAHFPAGETRLALTLNGQPRGRVSARFDRHGQLCVTESLLRQAGLRGEGLPAAAENARTCVAIATLWPQGVATPDPAENRLALLLPEDALADGHHYHDWQHGGAAGVLNYNAQYLHSRSRAWQMQFSQLQTEAGFNAGDWVVRSHQSWTHASGAATRFVHRSAWAQKTLFANRSLMRVGQFTLTGSGLGVGRIRGMQLTPEAALSANSGAALVSGVAASPAVIEIRQLNVLLHSTTVAPGAFTLRDFSLLNTHSDLAITQTESDGSQRHYTLPAPAYRAGGSRVAAGTALAVGRWDQPGSPQHPLVASASRGWQILPRTGLQSDLLLSTHYQASGFTSQSTLAGQDLTLNTTLTASAAGRGISGTLASHHPLRERLSLDLSAALQSPGFLDFSEAVHRNGITVAQMHRQIGASLNWYQHTLGSLSLSWHRSQLTTGRASDYAQLGWSRRVGDGYLSLTAGRQRGGVFGRDENSGWLSWQLPLGNHASLNTWFSQQANGSRAGLRYSQQLSQGNSWNIASERATAQNRNSVSAGGSLRTPWSQLSGNARYQSDSVRSLSLQADGAIVGYQNTLLLAPHRTGDTFAVARSTPGKPLRIASPGGISITNRQGYALLPALSPWRNNTLRLDTHSLPVHSDVANAIAELSPARGAVSEVEFALISARRMLLQVTDAAGQRLPPRRSVYDRSGTFITVTSEDGTLFLPDAKPEMTLKVALDNDHACHITLGTFNEPPAATKVLYQTQQVVCRVG